MFPALMSFRADFHFSLCRPSTHFPSSRRDNLSLQPFDIGGKMLGRHVADSQQQIFMKWAAGLRQIKMHPSAFFPFSDESGCLENLEMPRDVAVADLEGIHDLADAQIFPRLTKKPNHLEAGYIPQRFRLFDKLFHRPPSYSHIQFCAYDSHENDPVKGKGCKRDWNRELPGLNSSHQGAGNLSRFRFCCYYAYLPLSNGRHRSTGSRQVLTSGAAGMRVRSSFIAPPMYFLLLKSECRTKQTRIAPTLHARIRRIRSDRIETIQAKKI